MDSPTIRVTLVDDRRTQILRFVVLCAISMPAVTLGVLISIAVLISHHLV